MKYNRHKKRLQQHTHADDWLMTYADMITLLLCFFMVFLSMTLAKQKDIARLVEPKPEEEVVVSFPKTPDSAPSYGMPRIVFLNSAAVDEDEEGGIPHIKPSTQGVAEEIVAITLRSERQPTPLTMGTVGED